MPIDVGAFTRIRSAIERVVAADENPAGSSAFSQAVDTYRAQIRALLASETALLAEFDGLFPANDPQAARPSGGLLSAALRDPTAAHRLALTGMAGWLAGLVDAANAAAQRQANAEAYAREKVNRERGVGFRQE